MSLLGHAFGAKGQCSGEHKIQTSYTPLGWWVGGQVEPCSGLLQRGCISEGLHVWYGHPVSVLHSYE
jgi:hypothetical protein